MLHLLHSNLYFEVCKTENTKVNMLSLSLSPKDLVWIPSYILQVLAVIFGGMSILSGHVSTEQLTKYILYCEWLIYAAWRLQDSMSSLLQSVGACAKVFQLMHLPPSSEFMSKGRGHFLTIFFLTLVHP